MYNKAIKDDFLLYLKESNQPLFVAPMLKLFLKSEKFEDDLQIDIAYFDKNEILSFYRELSSRTENVMRRYIFYINKYVSWYKENIDSSVKKIKLTKAELNSCIQEIVVPWRYYGKDNIQHLQKLCISKQTAFLICCLHTGLKGEFLDEISLLSMDNIDTAKKTVTVFRYDFDLDKIVEDRTISISDEFIEMAKTTNEEQYYYDDIGRALGHLEQSKYIFKRREGSTNENMTEIIKTKAPLYRKKLMKFSNEGDAPLVDFSATSIHNSGIIDFIVDSTSVLDVPIDQILEESNAYIINKASQRFGVSKEHIAKIIKEYTLKMQAEK